MANIGVLIGQLRRGELFADEDRQRLERIGNVAWWQGDSPPSLPEAVDLLKDCEVGVGSWGTPCPCDEIMSQCTNLRLWEHVAGSVRRMFGPHLNGRDLTIASCAPAIGVSVAEMTVGQIICGLRGVFENAMGNRPGNEKKELKRIRLFDATVGVVGASRVGRKVIELLKPFRARVIVYDPFLGEEEAALLGVEKQEDLTRLCAESDVVTLHTPATPATENMLGLRQLQAIKDGAVFINTARGSCVDEAALIAELQKGRLFAFLDVSNPEPPADDSPLRRLDNVLYTSHIAGGPSRLLGEQAVNDIEAFLRGDEPEMVVTEALLDRLA